MQIMEIGRSWWARCNVSHAFYCFSWLLFQSPVTEALAMTRKAIEQCGLTWDDHRDPSTIGLCRSCTLTGHCIRYTLLVQDWTPFAFRTAFILHDIDSTRCWKYSSEILVLIDMMASRSCCRFVGCTSMMRISRSSTSQRCFIGLRSGDCGGRLSKVNSLSC